MTLEQLSVIAMTKEYSCRISLWKYDCEYSFSTIMKNTFDGHTDTTHYACTSKKRSTNRLLVEQKSNLDL